MMQHQSAIGATNGYQSGIPGGDNTDDPTMSQSHIQMMQHREQIEQAIRQAEQQIISERREKRK